MKTLPPAASLALATSGPQRSARARRLLAALFTAAFGFSSVSAQIPQQDSSAKPTRSSRRSISLAQIPTNPVAPAAPSNNPNTLPPAQPRLPGTPPQAAPSSNTGGNPQLNRPFSPRVRRTVPLPSPSGQPTTIPAASVPIDPAASSQPSSAPAGPPPAMTIPSAQPPLPGTPPQGFPGTPPVGQTAADPTQAMSNGKDPNEAIGVQFPQSPLPDILLWYEEETGKKIIRDINVEQVTITIDTTGQLPRKKAIEYVERSLLLNGYAFVPVDDETVKFMNVGAIKPTPEMTPENIFTDISKLPLEERIVTFIQPLQFIDAEDFRKSLGELLPQAHPYNIVSPLPNSRGVVITENSSTIRYILELLTHLDVEPSRTDTRTFQIQLSNAEDIAKALSDILGLEDQGKSGGSGSGSGSSKPAYNPNTAANAQPGAQPQVQPGQQPNPAARPAATPAAYGAAPQATAIPPKIYPIARTNKLLVMARPIDLSMIEKLIEELDGPAEIRNFTTRKLTYLNALDAFQIVQDAVTRGMDQGGSGGNGGPGTSQPGTLAGGMGAGTSNSNSSSSSNFNRSGSGGLGSSGFGSGFGSAGGSGFGGGGGMSGGSGDGLDALRQKSQPQSVVVGKTLIIVNPVHNEVFASGPPEQLRVINELFDEIDKRPQAVVINVVLGQLLLSDNRDVGIDYLFRPHQVKFGSTQGSIAGTAGTRVGTNSTFLDAGGVTPDKLLSSSGIGSGLALFGTLSDQLSVAISALSTNSDFKILSRPILHTLNNMKASINSGVQIPIPTAGFGNTGFGTGFNDGTGVNNGNNNGGFSSGGVAYQSVDLVLEVTPHINGDDEITLEVRQQNANEGGTTKINGNDISKITHQNLNTTVMVKNNSTVVLGGLIDEKLTKERAGLPILRHIPLIKYLASSSKDSKERSELLIFLQPRIVTGDGDQPPAYMDSAGSTTLGADARRFLNQEKSNPDPDAETIRRTKVGRILHKLFN